MSRSRFAIVFLTFTAAVLSGSCIDTTAPSETVEVSPATATLAALGDTTRLTAVFKDIEGSVVPGKLFIWASSDPLVATVDASGLVTAVADGPATITATSDGIQGSAALTIQQAVSTIEVSPASAALTSLGSTVQFSAVAKDANGNAMTGLTLSWISSNAAFATVDATGLATAVGVGTVSVTAVVGAVQGSASLSVALAGTGSNTLLVIANVNANDLGGGLFTTDFDVTVTDAAGPVSSAVVAFSNLGLGIVQLFETPAGSGIYTASEPGFPGGEFQLSVIRGSDNVAGVVVRGPGIHVITTPQANDIVPAAQPLNVVWTVPSQAEGAEIETLNLARLALPDSGAYMIAGAANPVNGSQRISVFRFNGVDITGGLVGSRLQVKIRAQVEPVVVQ